MAESQWISPMVYFILNSSCSLQLGGKKKTSAETIGKEVLHCIISKMIDLSPELLMAVSPPYKKCCLR